MAGHFIISLDCEGKWGSADHLQPYHRSAFTTEALTGAYRRLLTMFARYDVPATFAFVMALAMTPAERREWGAPLDDRGRVDPWLAHYWRDLDDGGTEGWYLPGAFDAVRDDGRHELASHSFCHRPLWDLKVAAPQAAAEQAAADALARAKGVTLATHIFPRNQVAHTDLLARAGYLGYRARRTVRGGALGSLGTELVPRPRADRPAEPAPLVAIPAGRFLNWRHGARRLVPPALTVARWSAMLEDAARTGGVAHLWLHPHNLVTGPGTAAVLDRILARAAVLREGGRLAIVTQADYCRALAHPSGGAQVANS